MTSRFDSACQAAALVPEIRGGWARLFFRA